MKAKEMERILFNDGWFLKNVKGSHHHYIHPTKQGKVTIPFHAGDLDIKTVKSIKTQAGIYKEESI